MIEYTGYVLFLVGVSFLASRDYDRLLDWLDLVRRMDAWAPILGIKQMPNESAWRFHDRLENSVRRPIKSYATMYEVCDLLFNNGINKAEIVMGSIEPLIYVEEDKMAEVRDLV